MEISVTHHRLEMVTRPEFPEPAQLVTHRVEIPNPSLNRFFYISVGFNWMWYSKVTWSYEQWASLAGKHDYETWVTYHQGTPIGYFELDRAVPERTEIASFGLLPEYTGRGWGRVHLNLAIAQAWREDTRLVWLDTCSLDSPAALPNYLKSGFQIAARLVVIEDVPEAPLVPWPESGLSPITSTQDHI
ncbi:MAG: GNAT family N-acetyltransferase [Pseudomonadota bacterium]